MGKETYKTLIEASEKIEPVECALSLITTTVAFAVLFWLSISVWLIYYQKKKKLILNSLVWKAIEPYMQYLDPVNPVLSVLSEFYWDYIRGDLVTFYYLFIRPWIRSAYRLGRQAFLVALWVCRFFFC